MAQEEGSTSSIFARSKKCESDSKYVQVCPTHLCTRRRSLSVEIAESRLHHPAKGPEALFSLLTSPSFMHTNVNNMSNSKFRAAILVVSTTASNDPKSDLSVEALKNVFDQDGGMRWIVSETKIVTDNVLDIQRSITAWADAENPVNLIITTGGTGFAVRDITPEVC